ncbi:hypothetical protein ACFQ34_18790 [Pseudonocardia benzenivorans]|jgi:hypothetical protein|uniref:Uncharacterized protein n=2 Tax=Pseudonocardia TaxID=1847 RepID=F4CR64_PSEUX|nr:hypothetical protein [Pseudonocardia dioxanivorans]AEA24501.1 hypothetical protein Psed_2288 [Pseudonocardia dioxanivorans CB1190]GJF01091.1 hypothetical protein PSD17_00550 [Pseudonocardia sp. D17]
MSTSAYAVVTGAFVVDDSGVRLGTAGEDGQVRDFAGVHIGSVDRNRGDVAVDFAGIRIGRVLGDEG